MKGIVSGCFAGKADNKIFEVFILSEIKAHLQEIISKEKMDESMRQQHQNLIWAYQSEIIDCEEKQERLKRRHRQNYEKYHEGFEAGQQEAYQDGFLDGYDSGLYTGHATGKTEGYEQGKKEGYDLGYAEGKDYGYFAGEQSTVKDDFGKLALSVVSAPFTAISNMLNFEIFGINLAGLVFFMFTAILIVFVLRRLL